MPALKRIGAAALSAFGFGTGAAAVTANFLVVAGGAGGGNWTGGGGGAGGYRTSAGTSGGGASAESALSLSLTQSYTVVVGAGGTGGVAAGPAGVNGSNSSFGALITSVGGGGGAGFTPSTYYPSKVGGSGGGGTTGPTSADTNGAAGTANQGYAGGNGQYLGNYPAGGGGGAGAVGGSPATNTSAAGNGGTGVASSITGSSVTYAGGGGGGANSGTAGTGGTGGGGNGSSSGAGSSGSANLGGGGGGSNGANSGGGNGGSGIVIISYTGAQQFGGGVVTSAAGNTIHTFYTSGVLSPLSSLSASYLIVAGGGGGGAGSAGVNSGSGAGAGGLLTASGLTIDTNSTYIISVGAGGAGAVSGTTNNGSQGSNSSFSIVSTTAVGGGSGTNNTGTGTGGNGGSGGGGAPTAGSATSGQGNAGGTSTGLALSGGGGAGAVGGSATTTSTGGNGGNGLASSISGSSVTYAGGGGGGGVTTGGSAGTGGGGVGGGFSSAGSAPGNGTANTGGGGGGAIGYISSFNGGSGGSGIVIIAYAGSTQQMSGGTVTVSGGNVIHTFTSSGYLSPLTNFSNSLRFRSSATAYLSRAFTTTGNTTTFTWSGWVKRGLLGSTQYRLFDNGGATNTYLSFASSTADTLGMNLRGTGGTNYFLETTAVYRDPAAWYHVVLAVDTTQATNTNRAKLYINGVQQSLTGSYPPQNQVQFDVGTRYIGSASSGVVPYDGYMTNINFIDGQALTPNSFGSFNQYGNWVPVTYGGSYGTNGFFLPFNAGAQTFSGSFNGSSQCLGFPASANLQLGTSDYTVEMWVYSNSYGSPVLYDGKTAAGTSIQFYVNSGVPNIYGGAGTGTLLITGSALPTGRWNHLALVRASNITTLYVNGVQSGASVTDTTNYNDANSGTRIGALFSGGANFFSGYMSNFRLVKGTAVYTANFTPSTTPLTAIANTQILTLQNSTIIDNSTNGFTITNTGSVTTATDLPLSTGIFNDQSPQGNNWTPSGISGIPGSTLDYMTDVPTLSNATSANYTVLNPLTPTNPSLINGNLATNSGSVLGQAYSTFTASTGKWYAEFIPNTLGQGYAGISSANNTGYVLYGSQGLIALQPGGSPTVASYTNGDVIGVAVNVDTANVSIYKNNTLITTQTFTAGNVTTSNWFFYVQSSAAGTGGQWTANFGQQPFVYTPPSGFIALNTFNM